MREEMKAGDAVVDGPENGNGPSLTIRYFYLAVLNGGEAITDVSSHHPNNRPAFRLA
jgi:hypothetical protein